MKCFYIHYFATDNAKRNKIECKELENDISSVSVVVILFFFLIPFTFSITWNIDWNRLQFISMISFIIGINTPFLVQLVLDFHQYSKYMLVYWFCLSIAHQSLLACFDLANFQLNLFFWFNQFHYNSSICYYLLLKFDYTFKRHREYDDRNLNT